MLSDPVAEAFGLIHRHPSGENLWYGLKLQSYSSFYEQVDSFSTRKFFEI